MIFTSPDPPAHLLASEAASSGVVGSSVHALLHVGLVGVALVGELLLRTRELRRVHSWIVSRHTRAHRVAPRVHGIVVVGHWVPQNLLNKDTKRKKKVRQNQKTD